MTIAEAIRIHLSKGCENGGLDDQEMSNAADIADGVSHSRGTTESKGTPLPSRNLISGGLVGVGFRPGHSLPESGDLGEEVQKLREYRVALGLHILNATSHCLVPQDSFVDGVMVSPSLPVAPAIAEGFIVRKHGKRATGSQGTCSWRIGDTDSYLVVGWSMPLTFAFSRNRLVVGLTTRPAGNCFKELFNCKKSSNDKFVRKSFAQDVTPALRLSLGGYHIVASMGRKHKTTACVTLMPDTLEDLDRSLYNFMLEVDEDEKQDY